MALSITPLFSDSVNATTTNATSWTTGSFTPPNNCLLVVFAAEICDDGNDSEPTLTLSGGGLTWTKQVVKTGHVASNYPVSVAMFTAPVTTGSSMTLMLTDFNIGSFQYSISLRVNSVTGYNTSTPIGATANGATTGVTGASSITLSSTPAASSIIFAGTADTDYNDGQTGITEGIGWTVLNAYESLDGWVLDATQYITGSTSTTVPWQALAVGTGMDIHNQAACAIEILAAAGGGETITIDKWWLPPQYLRYNTELIGY